MGTTVLLTGRPGCGKTTVIHKTLALIDRPAGGFYTREIRRSGQRLGFEIVSLDGQTAILAHVDLPGPQRVGKYGLDLRALESLGVAAVKSAIDQGGLVVIDEIGPMEMRSPRFKEIVLEALDSRSTVLGTIVQRSTPFSDKIKRRSDVTLFEVQPSNRDTLPAQLTTMLVSKQTS
jgi:nucleoside-triphosphatase